MPQGFFCSPRPKDDSLDNISTDESKKFLIEKGCPNKMEQKELVEDKAEYKAVYEFIINKNDPAKILSRVIGWLRFIFYLLRGRQEMDLGSLVNEYYLY